MQPIPRRLIRQGSCEIRTRGDLEAAAVAIRAFFADATNADVLIWRARQGYTRAFYLPRPISIRTNAVASWLIGIRLVHWGLLVR